MDFDDSKTVMSSEVVLNPAEIQDQDATVAFEAIDLAQLVFVEGFRKNESLPILKERITIGRDPASDVSITDDHSVSRHHASIEIQNHKYILIPSKSRNGILHNGTLCQEESVPLEHGDRIQIGRTIIRFELMEKVLAASAEASEPKPDSSSSSLFKSILIAGVVLLVVGGLAWFAISKFGTQSTRPGPQKTKRRTIPVRSATTLKQRKRFQRLLNKGMNLYKKRKWREAIFAFHKASALNPNNPAALQLAKDARAELNSFSVLASVKKILDMEDIEECEQYRLAWKKLSSLGSQHAPGSVYAEQLWQQQFNIAQSLKRSCRRRRRNQPSLPRVRTAMAKPMAKLINRPNRRKITGAMLFNGGQLKKARKKFKDQDKTDQLDDFISSYNRGRTAYKSRDAIAGIPQLKKALKLDKKLGGGQSLYTPQIHRMLANLHYFAGLNAIEYKKNYTFAIRHFRKALRYNPRHTGSQNQLKALRRLAESWHRLAMRHLKAARNTEARRLLRKAIQILPRNSQLYRNIRSQLLNFKR